MNPVDIIVTLSEKNYHSKDSLYELLNHNIHGFRFNLSRESYDWVDNTISTLVDIGFSADRFYLDIGNNKVRLQNKNNETVIVRKEQEIIFSKNSFLARGLNITATISNEIFFETVSNGDQIIVGDGDLELLVNKTENDLIYCKALWEGELNSGSSLFLREKDLFDFVISNSEKKIVDNLLNRYPCNLIVSFVGSKENIEWTKLNFPQANAIIPKIESKRAVNNLESIIRRANKVLIGRGDLGLAVGVEKIGLIQNKIIYLAKKFNVEVYIATEMLESIQYRKLPLRAEVVDITNSCSKNVKGLILTSETASSPRPFTAIENINNIISAIQNEPHLL